MGLTHPCRHIARGLVGLALASLILAAADTAALAQAKKSENVVKVTATADKPDADGKQTVTITLDVEKPWHVYANPVGNEDFENARTVVTVTAKEKPEEVKIDYPAGKEFTEVGEKFKIYEDKVTIKAHVRRARGDTSPLEVAVKLQACSPPPKGTCLLPSTVKLTVP